MSYLFVTISFIFFLYTEDGETRTQEWTFAKSHTERERDCVSLQS